MQRHKSMEVCRVRVTRGQLRGWESLQEEHCTPYYRAWFDLFREWGRCGFEWWVVLCVPRMLSTVHKLKVRYANMRPSNQEKVVIGTVS